MNREILDFALYEALHALPMSGTERRLVYSGALRGQTIGDTLRSIAYYRLGDREGGIHE
jgi:hypothetical protein